MRLRGTAASGLVAISLTLALLMIVPPLLGYSRYVLVGNSMEPTVHKGSVIYDEAVPVSQLRRGDIVTYLPPPQTQTVAHDVTHRIIWVGKDRAGRAAFRTKGDHNAAADPWTFVLTSASQARYVFAVPGVGYVLAALSVKWVRMLLLGLPAALIALGILANLWREAGVTVERELRDAGRAVDTDDVAA
jgi:signal peptidase